MKLGTNELYGGKFLWHLCDGEISHCRDGMYHTDNQFPVEGDIATYGYTGI